MKKLLITSSLVLFATSFIAINAEEMKLEVMPTGHSKEALQKIIAQCKKASEYCKKAKYSMAEAIKAAADGEPSGIEKNSYEARQNKYKCKYYKYTALAALSKLAEDDSSANDYMEKAAKFQKFIQPEEKQEGFFGGLFK